MAQQWRRQNWQLRIRWQVTSQARLRRNNIHCFQRRVFPLSFCGASFTCFSSFAPDRPVSAECCIPAFCGGPQKPAGRPLAGARPATAPRPALPHPRPPHPRPTCSKTPQTTPVDAAAHPARACVDEQLDDCETQYSTLRETRKVGRHFGFARRQYHFDRSLPGMLTPTLDRMFVVFSPDPGLNPHDNFLRCNPRRRHDGMRIASRTVHSCTEIESAWRTTSCHFQVDREP